jgi:hypothetical protein
MSNNRIYIETPIDQTEGLEEKFYWIKVRGVPQLQFKEFENGHWDVKHTSIIDYYLRPAPDNSVVVTEEELKRFANSIKMLPLTCFNEPKLSEIVNKFIQTKLAQ